MCGRFTLTYTDHERLAEELGVPADALHGYRPRYNIAPTDEHWIVRTRYEDREVLPARWGLVNFWMKDRKQAFKNINARAETVQKSPSFREAFKEHRCIIPADGFFEWTGPREARMPISFHRSDDKLIYFAGLYESWRPSPDEKERTFTIITTKPNSLMEPVHNRMPVVLGHDAAEEWMYTRQDPKALLDLLKPPPDDFLVATPVSPRVNSVKNDDPECLLPPSATEAIEHAKQASLFDG
ncbi:MAG TPA: SOS response-associated peptidase [Dehalococcoidia bacterium]|nr:SOS response-associated peptidase [Dehalococcoidia bacterium]